jgi:hypothetical protein
MNDADSFDTDRLSGSIQYDDDQQDPVLNDNIPRSNMDYETIRRNDKKSKNQVFSFIFVKI